MFPEALSLVLLDVRQLAIVSSLGRQPGVQAHVFKTWSHAVLMQSNEVTDLLPPLGSPGPQGREELAWSLLWLLRPENTFSVHWLHTSTPRPTGPRPLAKAAWVFPTDRAAFLRLPCIKGGPGERGSSPSTDQTAAQRPGLEHTSHADERIRGPEIPLAFLLITLCK